MGRALAAALSLIVSLAGLYAVAALLGSFILVGGDVRDGEAKTRLIHVLATPIHADIVVPIVDDVADWRPLVQSEAFPGDANARAQLAEAAELIAIGWGAQAFYFNVHRLSDTRPRYVADAIWDDGTVHATALAGAQTMPSLIPVRLDEAGYRRLIAALQATFERDEAGRPIPVVGESYFAFDGFFQAVPDYSLLRSCNVWAASVLAEAGVRVPLWGPFSFALVRALTQP